MTRVARIAFSLLCLALPPALAVSNGAQAQVGSDRYSSIVIEAATGNVLSAVNADEPRHPASLTKMMTLYMLFEALRDRRIGLDDAVPVSLHAAAMEPSKLGLRPGMRLTVEEAVLGLVTKSANDAAAALGELLGGDEARFAQMMTLRARALGMSRTVFRNASGLPDPDQVTTARDLATLGRHLAQDYPSEYRYFSTPSFVFHGRTIFNHDPLLQSYPGADGIKTGWIESSGHNLVTSAVHGNVRLVGVVLGATSNPERDVQMTGLLDAGFERLDVPPLTASYHEQPRVLAPLMASAQAGSLPQSMAQALRSATARAALMAPPAPPPEQQPRAGRGNVIWGLQVGSFASEAVARQAAIAAHRAAGTGAARVEQAVVRGHVTWRAQVIGLTEVELRSASAHLARRRIPAQPVHSDGERVASR